MISVDTSALEKHLKQIAEETEKNLVNMVERFAVELAQTASNNTPIGDQDVLDEYFSGQSLLPQQYRYVRYYLNRVQNYGIEAQAGFHRGAFTFNDSGNFSFDRNIHSQPEMLTNVKSGFRSNYKLGERFYIGGEGPGYVMLERGSSAQAPNGIVNPTVDDIVSAYSSNLQYFYRSN